MAYCNIMIVENKLKEWAILKEKDFKEKIRTAIFISDTIEKIFSIFKLIDDASEGIEEIEKEFIVKNRSIKK